MICISHIICVPNMPAAVGPWCERPSQEWILVLPMPIAANASTLYTVDLLNSFQELKLISPGFSSQAFAKLLVHCTLCAGRVSMISEILFTILTNMISKLFSYTLTISNVFSYTDIPSSLDRSTGMPCRGAFLSLHTPPLRKTSYAVIPLSPALPAHLKW